MRTRIINKEVERRINLYVDEDSESLDDLYDISKHDVNEIRGGTLGKYEREEAARKLLAFSVEYGEIVGVPLEVLASEGDTLSKMVRNGYFRITLEKNNITVLYPTEKLLENQKVPKKE